ncbi:CopL family metal-binding regulatory protein [Tahibacter sp.]|uniref:CopL family metal-binding regulatory protein n=1 Tax=Tahibacter sp. TaxID=2056211 RepID=UPI0028C49D7B|nr:CopL family metal-binding regulatory protein [Tahibacter sp.]
MPLHSLTRWSLRVLLALCLIVSGMAVGAGGNTLSSVRVAGEAPSSSEAAPDMPCHGLAAAAADTDQAPCDCCPQRSCDTAVCAIPGCLPSLPFVAASAPPATAPNLGSLAAPPSAPLEPPLRPPIA